MTVMQSVMQTASQFNKPDSLMGYGIPDFLAAFQTLSVGQRECANHNNFTVSPSFFIDNLIITNELNRDENFSLSLLDVQGKLILEKEFQGGNRYFYLRDEIRNLKPGLYILQISYSSGFDSFKLIKLKQ
jgi:hypothetical protein